MLFFLGGGGGVRCLIADRLFLHFFVKGIGVTVSLD